MLGKIGKFVSELGFSLIAVCLLYGVAGLCLGLDISREDAVANYFGRG